MARAVASKGRAHPGRWQREVKGIAALALAGFSAFALAIFDPRLRLGDQASPVGPLGVWLGWAIFRAFGYAGYVLPLALAFYGVSTFFRRGLGVRWPALTGCACLVVSLTGLLARASDTLKGVPKGGIFGWGVVELLRLSVGEAGALLVLLALIPIGGLFLTQASYAALLSVLREWLRTLHRRTKAEPRPVELSVVPAAPALLAETVLDPVPPPIVVEPQKPKPGLAERGLAWQETFDFGKGGRTAFQLPPIGLLKAPPEAELRQTREELQANADILRKKLQDFGVEGRIVQVNPGPVITSYEFEPAPGIKVSQVVNLADDLALAMKAASVRIVGPIPGRGTVAMEVPNPEIASVYLREILVSREFVGSKGKLPLALGKDAIGTPYVADLTQMPHLLIAGATGSGKSVGLNAMICSILYKATPAEVRFLMIDPKRLELGIYEGIPHLMAPVVTDAREAAARLKWIVGKMDARYKLLAERHVRNIESHNREVSAGERLPYWVVIVDELADLMMASAGEVQNSLVRLAQVARAVGIHLIIATQRPSVDVITGLIKANFPARIAFQVASKVDSRTVLDGNGAETLLGRGDMLFVPPGTSRPVRIHGSWVAEDETKAVCDFLRKQGSAVYEEIGSAGEEASGEMAAVAERDEIYWDAVQLVISQRQASISFLQRRLRLGYPKAARFIDMMEQDRIIGPGDGAKPREVLVGADFLARRAK
ncbi:MAG: DNA translocase FtsK 4TM domain-containing protein [Candidatus Rokubacteria bacterium]|nr:DNA translocase FtsK 4TM domain-containing protein [Candidatus Rokubacteria bacterium]